MAVDQVGKSIAEGAGDEQSGHRLFRRIAVQRAAGAGTLLVDRRRRMPSLGSHFASDTLNHLAGLRDRLSSSGGRLACQGSGLFHSIPGSCLDFMKYGLALIELALNTCPRLRDEVIDRVPGIAAGR